MGGVVGVQRFFVLAVVPVVKVGGDDDVAQRPETHVDVAMVKHSLKTDDDDVGINHFFAEPQNKDAAQNGGAGDQHFDDMQARTRHPVHVFGAVVHGVQTP